MTNALLVDCLLFASAIASPAQISAGANSTVIMGHGTSKARQIALINGFDEARNSNAYR